ncbi:hypothetical protein [Streptomyces narbonensis]
MTTRQPRTARSATIAHATSQHLAPRRAPAPPWHRPAPPGPFAATAVLGGLLVGTAAPALAAAPGRMALVGPPPRRPRPPRSVSAGAARAAAAPDRLAVLSVWVEA